MRLLFVIDNLGSGGAQRQMVALALGLSRRGHAIEFFVYSPADFFGPALRDAAITIWRHAKPSRFSPRPVADLRRRIRGGGYDAVLSFMPVPNLYAVLATRCLRNRPLVVVSERSMDLGAAMDWQSRVAAPFYRLADRVVANSHHRRESLCRTYPALANRASTIWNGVDLDAFRAIAVPPKTGPLRLLGIGRVEPFKNWRCLVEALAIARDRFGVDATLSLVGRWDAINPNDVACRATLDAAIVQRGLTKEWTWLGERSDIVNLLAEHHALVHPSYAEGLPNTVCEALACGRPTIVSNVLDHPRLVQDGLSGYLFDPRQPDDLAHAIRKLHSLSDDQRRAMGQCARSFAEKNLSLDRLADEYEQLFHNLIGHAVATIR